MLSARHWKDRRVPWHTLVFWLWLVGFVFSFAANDLFHAPTCPERLLLHWAAHPTPSLVQLPATLVLNVEVDCAACAFQSAATAILVVLAWAFIALVAEIGFSSVLRWKIASRLFVPIARGPPRSPLFSTSSV